jgi:hypothetical protein
VSNSTKCASQNTVLVHLWSFYLPQIYLKGLIYFWRYINKVLQYSCSVKIKNYRSTPVHTSLFAHVSLLNPVYTTSVIGTVPLNLGPRTQTILVRYASFLSCKYKPWWHADQIFWADRDHRVNHKFETTFLNPAVCWRNSLLTSAISNHQMFWRLNPPNLNL